MHITTTFMLHEMCAGRCVVTRDKKTRESYAKNTPDRFAVIQKAGRT
jgi:hypothetical protein